MILSFVYRLQTAFHLWLMSKEEQHEFSMKLRQELLKELLPEAWLAYNEYHSRWAEVGIYMLQFPSFEEFLEKKPLSIKPQVTRLLAGVELA